MGTRGLPFNPSYLQGMQWLHQVNAIRSVNGMVIVGIHDSRQHYSYVKKTQYLFCVLQPQYLNSYPLDASIEALV